MMSAPIAAARNLLLATAAAGLTASGALAADLVEPAAFDWSGPYIGLNAGYAWTETEGSIHIPEGSVINDLGRGFVEEVKHNKTNADGFTGGLTVGFNHQVDNFVLGIEGDANYLDVDGSGTKSSDFAGGVRLRDRVNGDFLATLRLRAGFALDQTLVYATGGVAYTDIEVERTLDWAADTCPTVDGLNRCHSGDTSFDFGWTVGAGIEHAFDERWSIKAEYLFADFGDEDFTSSNVSGPPGVQTLKHSFDLEMHIVRAGLNFRF
jgi:outer membrane immunogenic protein